MPATMAPPHLAEEEAVKAGDQVETPLGPALLVEIQWRRVWVFGRLREEAMLLVELPDEQRRFYRSDQVWPLERRSNSRI